MNIQGERGSSRRTKGQPESCELRTKVCNTQNGKPTVGGMVLLFE